MERENIKTFDNKKLAEGGFEVLTLCLFKGDMKGLEKLGKSELAYRMVENFIMANTKDDIMEFVRHHFFCTLADEVIDMLGELDIDNNKK